MYMYLYMFGNCVILFIHFYFFLFFYVIEEYFNNTRFV